MKELKMKAMKGVTLVELLVVILIVTILSVSMLPLLQPFVIEAQYAAEAIPVIGNLRTKIGLYQYDKGTLPFDNEAYDTYNKVETWTMDSTKNDVYIPAVYDFADLGVKRTTPVTLTEITDITEKGGHIGKLLDIDYQDLKGKRSKPLHYQYFAISTNTQSYVLGVFGNNSGLKSGTGYAVCELNFTTVGRKMIGTWKRYKALNEQAGAIAFSQNYTEDTDANKVLDCYIPTDTLIDNAADSATVDNIIGTMTGAGWEF